MNEDEFYDDGYEGKGPCMVTMIHNPTVSHCTMMTRRQEPLDNSRVLLVHDAQMFFLHFGSKGLSMDKHGLTK